MPFKDKNKKKIKRKKGKKFVYNNPSDGLTKDKKKNPFEELSKKKHTKQMKEYKGILDEYKNRFTTNTFIDRRIGEHSKNLSQDEKMKLRFKAQQMINLKTKKNKFSLLNEDDDNLGDHVLTHNGMKLDQVGFDDEMEKSDDEFFDKMDNYMEEMDNNKKLSRKEIIQNIINKSKLFKQEKQKLKKETKDQIQLLDDNFGELSTLLKKRERTFNTVRDDYDKFTKIFENSDKTHPTEKIKTEKEIQLEKENQIKRENKRKIKEEIAEMENEGEENKEAPDENVNVDKQLTKKERIEKLIGERLKKTEKIKKEDIVQKKKKDNNIAVDDEAEDDDNASDLGEFEGDDNEDEEGEYEDEEGEYDDEEGEFDDEEGEDVEEEGEDEV